MKKVFSIKDESLEIDNGVLRLLEYELDGDGYMVAIASTDITDCHKDSRLYSEIYNLPQSLILITREELNNLISKAKSYNDGWDLTEEELIASLTPPIYPHTITVEHDGTNYLWDTLIAEYE